jgi:fatty-acyl-CoA synthase
MQDARSLEVTPTAPDRDFRLGGFSTIAEALDYAALQPTGFNIHSLRGEPIEVLAYADLRQQALAMAARLLTAGLEPGDRVALAATSDGDFLRAFFACQYAGLTPVPLPLPAPFGGKEVYVAHVRRMMQSSKARAGFAPHDIAGWFVQAAEGLDLEIVGDLADLPQAGEVSLPTPDPDGLCYLQFSSGSTRFPLGVAVTQRALIANASALAKAGAATGRDRAVSWLPLYHDMGLVGFVLMPVLCQMSVDMLPTAAFVRRPMLWLDMISRNRGTFSYSPTFGYELAARRAEAAVFEHLDLSCWKIAGLGGDMVRAKPLQAFADIFASTGFSKTAFVASYGLAEATLGLTMAPLGEGLRTDLVDIDRLETEGVAVAPGVNARSREFALCGVALSGHTVEVRDDNGRPVGERRVGRIFAKGPGLMQAYFGRPEETAEVIGDDGWLDTGDLGYVVDGQLAITGRAKDLIIINGRNIWPQDLEWTMEAAVVGLRSGDTAAFSINGEGEERVITVVECRTSDSAARHALSSEIAGLLRTKHGVEVEVVLVPPRSLPQTSSGKLSRSRAKAMYQGGAFAQPVASMTA